MSFKLNFNPSEDFALNNHTIIEVSGRDAGAFLQSQFMNDVQQLSDGHWQYTGWLNAQGRVLALFYLLRINAEQFVIVLPALSPEYLITALKAYVFRSKVQFLLHADWHATGKFMGISPDVHTPNCFVGNFNAGILLSIQTLNFCREIRITHTASPVNDEWLNHWHEHDMHAGWPWIDESLQNLWTPHMLSLQKLPAFSIKKGCYPGQEIVARTHFLGQSKRHLQPIVGSQMRNAQSLFVDQREVAKVVNANASGEFAIAVVSSSQSPEQAFDDGSSFVIA